MGLFDFLKKKSLFSDPFFGELRHRSVRSASWFDGKRSFAPLGTEVNFSIDADADGPTEAQRSFYQMIERDYSSLIDKIKPMLEDEFRNWKEDFTIQDFNKEFILDHIQIPRQEITPLKWELAFTTVHDQDHYFTIEFEGMEPGSVLIDG